VSVDSRGVSEGTWIVALAGLDDPLAFAASGDPLGRQWITDLPKRIARLTRDWDLKLDGRSASHGFNAIVVPVLRSGERCVLKVTWPEERSEQESEALSAWDGGGAVELIAARTELGALLLERLDADRPVEVLDLMDAAEVAGALVRRLTVPAPDGFPEVRDIAEETATSLPADQETLGEPVPHRWIDAAVHLARELGADSGANLVHSDIHYGNILAGEREPWLAIDPRPVVGDPEYAIPELLWTRLDEVDGSAGVRRLLATLVESGDLDANKARGWALVRAIDYLLWGLLNGLTDDPVRCRRIIEALVD
jgi:streptomycin 6-kinase